MADHGDRDVETLGMNPFPLIPEDIPPGPPPDLGSAIIRLGWHMAPLGRDAMACAEMVASELSRLYNQVRELERALNNATAEITELRKAEIAVHFSHVPVIEEREACAKAVNELGGMRSAIGPLHGAGWNAAIDAAEKAIRARGGG